MQTDPIGYADGLNMYAYVGNDPMNWVDPLGLFEVCNTTNIQRTQTVWKYVQARSSDGNIVIRRVKTETPADLPMQSCLNVPDDVFDVGGAGLGTGLSPENGEEGPGCRSLRERADRLRKESGLRYFDNDNWDSLQTLSGYRDLYQEHVDGLSWLARLETALVVTTAMSADAAYTNKFKPEMNWKQAFGRSWVVGATAAVIMDQGLKNFQNNRNYVSALNARIEYLKTCLVN